MITSASSSFLTTIIRYPLLLGFFDLDVSCASAKGFSVAASTTFPAMATVLSAAAVLAAASHLLRNASSKTAVAGNTNNNRISCLLALLVLFIMAIRFFSEEKLNAVAILY